MSSAIRFESANGEYLSRTASVINYNSTYAWQEWLFMSSDTGADAHILLIDTGGGTNYDLWRIQPDRSLYVERNAPGGITSASGTTLSIGTWYWIAVEATAADIKLYLNNVLDITVTQAVGARAAADRMLVGAHPFLSSYWLDGRLSGMRAWQTNLSSGERAAEMVSPTAVKAGAWEDWPTPAGATRAEGTLNGRHWTENGTLSDEDGPLYGTSGDVTITATIDGISGTAEITVA